MRSLGLDDLSIDRSTIQHVFDMFGCRGRRKVSHCRQLRKRLTSVQRINTAPPQSSTRADPRRHHNARRDGIAVLRACIAKIYSAGNGPIIIWPHGVACKTGNGRLKGQLHTGTEVAHKSGTAGHHQRTLGLSRLPNHAGQIAAAAFIQRCENRLFPRASFRTTRRKF